MNSKETLKNLGTISLGCDFIRRMIGFGRLVRNNATLEVYIDKNLDKGNLELSVWFEFIPEVFRPGAFRAAHRASAKAIEISPKASERSLDIFVNFFQTEMRDSINEGYLSNRGWELSPTFPKEIYGY